MERARLISRRKFLLTSGLSGIAVASGVTPLGGLVRSALAQDSGRAVRYINSNDVNLRTGAGLGFDIITTLDTGERVEVIDSAGKVDGYEWVDVEVTSTGQLGFVALDFLSRIPGGAPADDYPIGSQFVVDTVDGGPANLRSAPGTSAGVVRSLSTGLVGVIESGPTSANGYRWFQVSIDGSEGFVADVVVSPSGGGNPAPEPNPSGYEPGSTIVVIDGPLNLRSEPFFGPVIATYPTNTRGVVLSEANDGTGDVSGVWYEVRLNDGTVGYFAGAYLGLADDASGELRIVDGPLNVRKTPNGTVIDTLATGTYGEITGGIPVIEGDYEWIQVRFYTTPEIIGWVAGDFIEYT